MKAMPPKRKRPDEPAAQPDPQSSVTRRATRQTPVHPPHVPPSASVLSPPALVSAPPAPAAAHKAVPTTAPIPAHSMTAVPLPSFPSIDQQKRGRGRPPGVAKQQQQQQQQQPLPPPPPPPAITPPLPQTTAANSVTTIQTRVPPPLSSGAVRVPVPLPTRRGPTNGSMRSIAAIKENVRPPDLVAPEITYHVPQANHHGGRQSSLVRPHGPTAPPPRLEKIAQAPPVVTPVLPPKPPTLPVSDRLPPRTDRNIDKVVLGNLCFRTWYPSYYGKEVLGDTSSNLKGIIDGAKESNTKAQSKKDKDHQPMLERLYVCPSCFKYAKELVAWWGHVKFCQQRSYVPGRKIYVHPKGRRTVYIAQDGTRGAGPKKRRGEGGVRYVEEIVQDEGEWSIWEVDGEQHGLFCQNLSLFAKLFLDNKSVFFDVMGFNYFLLVYTPPHPTTTTPEINPPPAPPQITGFFSKEKMSWDNNNLACILVFPPWQRKGLGALLMGASYEISRREGIMGGPEKPISDLGKKGYKRFWSGEIARWLLSLDTGLKSGGDGQETIVDVEDCSQATWITAEDCLMVLRDMGGVVEDAGVGPRKPERVEEHPPQPPAEDEKKRKTPGSGDEEPKHQPHPQDGTTGGGEEDKPKAKREPSQVPRVKIDKESVRRYVAAQRLRLDKTCDPGGFVEGYAIKVDTKAASEDVEIQDED